MTFSLMSTYEILWKKQPGLIKIRTSVHFLARLFLRTFRRSFKEKCPPSGAKAQVPYVALDKIAC